MVGSTKISQFVLAVALLVVLGACGGSTTLVQAPETAATPAVPTSTPLATPEVAATTTVAPASAPDPCDAGPDRNGQYNLQVKDVAPDDPDGGLVVHSGVGVDAPVIGVLPWNTNIVIWNYGQCEILDSGAMWVGIRANDIDGWVNARYLGDRVERRDDLSVTPCTTTSNAAPVTDVSPSAASAAEAYIHDISVQSSPACDRIVFELGSNLDPIPGQAITSLDAFPVDAIRNITANVSSVEVNFAFAPNNSGLSPWPEVWRDAATNELNAALVLEKQDSTAVRVGWGTGTAAVRYLDNPARVVVDVMQTPTPAGEMVGPMTAGGAIIFDPISNNGPIEDSFQISGWSYGFEAQSSLRIATWDQTSNAVPDNWQGTIFGTNAVGVDATIEPKPNFRIETGSWAFGTRGPFAFTVSDLDPGGYQLLLSGDTGCGGPSGVVLQFHVGPTTEHQAAHWFALGFGDRDDTGSTPIVITEARGERLADWPVGPC